MILALLAACTGDPADTGPGETGDSAPPASGPCATYGEPTAMDRVDNPLLDELSGLAVSRLNPGVLWTHEDSGAAADLTALDATGATLATVHLDGVVNTDWEDLAVAPCADGWCLYVGDIGTLGTDRADFAVLVLPEPLLDGTPELTVTPEVRPFRYPGDPEDAEGLAVTAEGEPLVVTKREDATAGVYVLPDGADVLTPVATVPTGDEGLPGAATAADLWLDPPTLLLRTYLHLYSVDVADLTAPGDPVEVPFALELQGEAVAWDPAGGYWQVAEGMGPVVYRTACLE